MARAKKVILKGMLTRVIRASWDASLDYFIPITRAIQLYAEGKLHKDITTGCYTSKLDCLEKTPGPKVT
jgi:hypothetical protein